MAISTKVITMRQGNKSDYQPSKMLSGELAVINDAEELHFSPKTGKSIRVATENDLKKVGNTVDDALSETSTNPVQNKVVTAKFRELSGQISDLQQGGTGGSGTVSEVSIFKGLTASFYGDSLTEKNYHYTKGYHQWIKELLGLASYNNYGVSGYKVSDVLNKVNSVTDTSDIIFVMIGVNDVQFNVPLGTFSEMKSETVYGNLKLVCEKLQEKYPTKLIVFITPHEQTKYPSTIGVSMYDVAKAVIEVCEKYSIVVYNNFVYSEIHSKNLSYWTTDGCHWNDKAHEMLGRNLSKFMMDTFRYYYGYAEDEEPDVPDTPVTYTITRNLTNCKSSKTVTTVTKGTAHTETITANSGYTLTGATVSVTMGGANISSYYSNGVLDIPSVTGNIVITVSAVTETTEPDEPEVTLTSISATYNGGSVLVGTSVNALTNITVKANYSDGTSKTVTGYSLSGTISEGSNTVTISYGGKSTTITVIGYVENEPEITLTNISVVYTGGDVPAGTVLTDLTGITVTATYSDGSTANVTDYTLTGTIIEGSNTITVTYSDKTTTFIVVGLKPRVITPIVINNSVDNVTYENNTLTMTGAHQTFYGVEFKDAQKIKITNFADSANRNRFGWILIGTETGYKGIGVTIIPSNLKGESYDVDATLTKWTNRQQPLAETNITEPLEVKIINGIAHFYSDGEEFYSVEGTSIGFAMSADKSEPVTLTLE